MKTFTAVVLVLLLSIPQPKAQIGPAVFCLAITAAAAAGVIYVFHCTTQKIYAVRNVDDTTGKLEGDCFTMVLRCAGEAPKRGVGIIGGPFKEKSVADQFCSTNVPAAKLFTKLLHFESSADTRTWKEFARIDADPECFEVALTNNSQTVYVRAWY